MARQRIEQRATTSADPATVYALLRDGAGWPRWSPIESFSLEREGKDEREGVGAVRVFRGGRVTGRDEIVELVPDRRFAYRHTSNLPLRDYLGVVDLEPVDGGTEIRWVSTFRPAVPGTGRLLRRALDRFVGRLAHGLAEHAAGVARTPVAEARLVETEAGRKPEGDGWFVVNLADAAGVGTDDQQYHFGFERAHRAFPHFGINVSVLAPGRPGAMYHAEAGQEAFLVLEGECTLIVEDQERRLRQWDFFHCPPWTAHVLVGAGDGPCAVLMVGARSAGRAIVYPPSAAAARYGAAVEEETRDSRAAYAGWPPLAARRYPWPPRRE